ncbi:response regulator [Sphingomonas sp. UYP23]
MTVGRRIVIVEDDVLIAMDLADLLIAMGHEVCAIVSSESEAVAAATRWKPNLMIVDANLSEGSGVSAMREILARGFVAHLYITGDPVQLLKVVPDAVVVAKPFNMRGLATGMATVSRIRNTE